MRAMSPKTPLFAALAVLAGAAGCDRCLAQRPSETTTTALDAASSPTQSSTGGGAASGARPTVSLLPVTDSRVAVSSTVDNPKDYPEHLIDGKLDTAWNGRTGDLAGFIAFRVPREVHVASVQLTVGFDKVDKEKRDLFTANHRISRVRISRDGVLVREAALDVNRRGLQSIAIERPGGDFEIRVLETVPGTNANWKELVVSELVVLGDPGGARRAPPHIPRVRVGSLDAPETQLAADADAGAGAEPGKGPWPSIVAYCSAFKTAAKERARGRTEDPNYPCAEHVEPSCGADDRVALSGVAPFSSTQILTTSDGVRRARHVAVETSLGWWPRAIYLDGSDECILGDVGSESSEVKATKPVGTSAIAVEIERRFVDPMYTDLETGQPAMWVRDDGERFVEVCRATGGEVRCDERHVLGKYSGRLDDKPAPFEKWSGRHGYRIDAADGGTIVLTP